MAGFLEMTEHDFIQRYLRLRPQRDGLALVDKGPAPMAAPITNAFSSMAATAASSR